MAIATAQTEVTHVTLTLSIEEAALVRDLSGMGMIHFSDAGQAVVKDRLWHLACVRFDHGRSPEGAFLMRATAGK